MAGAPTFQTWEEFDHVVFRSNHNLKWIQRARRYLPQAEYEAVAAAVKPLEDRKAELVRERAAIKSQPQHSDQQEIDLNRKMTKVQESIRKLYQNALRDYGRRTFPSSYPSKTPGQENNQDLQQKAQASSQQVRPPLQALTTNTTTSAPLGHGLGTGPTTNDLAPPDSQVQQPSADSSHPVHAGPQQAWKPADSLAMRPYSENMVSFGLLLNPDQRRPIPGKTCTVTTDSVPEPQLGYSPFWTLSQSRSFIYTTSLSFADFTVDSTVAAIVVENRFVPENGHHTPLWRCWWLDLEIQRSEDLVTLGEIDPVILVEFAERHGTSSVVVQTAIRGFFSRSELTLEESTETIPMNTITPSCFSSDFHAWFFKTPGQQNKYLLSGLYNDLPFGLAPSIVLETIFQKNPSAFVRFTSFGLQHYVVDMTKMTMTNLYTTDHSSWELTREKVDLRVDIDPKWLPMNIGGPKFMIVPVGMADPHLKQILDLIPQHFISNNVTSRVDVMGIYGIQNPRLEHVFKVAGDDLRDVYSEYPEINFQSKLVFHGTSPMALASICEKNFDWRRSGEAVGTKFGKGCYFGTSFGISHHYTAPSVPSCHSHGQRGCRRFMFAVELHVGLCFVGNPNVTYPPVWKKSVAYDTAVDNLSRPTMFVKFDKEHMVPRYVIEYTLIGIDD